MARNFLSIFDLSRDDMLKILRRSGELKQEKKQRRPSSSLEGMTIGVMFEKLSTRTRVSFEVGISDLGANAVYLDPKDTQLGRNEPIPDTARVLSSYLNGIVIRTYDQERINEFARHSSVPVINALTDLEHPTQVISDLYTVQEKGIDPSDFHMAYIGDGNNVTNSLVGASAIMGFDLTVACPAGHEPDETILKRSTELGQGRVRVTSDPEEAVKEADVIYTDVWVSMGQDGGDKEEKIKKFQSFQINSELLRSAKSKALIMHCLPAHRGEEITDEVIESRNSIIFDQAENKLHSAKAILEHFLVV